MLVCDFCKKEINQKNKTPKIKIHTEFACRAWQQIETDICEECRRELKEKINQAEAEFYQNKIKSGGAK